MLFFFLLAFPVAVWAQSTDIEIEPVRTSITVREAVEAESSGYVTAVDAESLDSRPGVNIDDRLRDIPGFSLFRRSSSLVAHPTTQGVSLRGIGSSAAGRTLVLYDGFPVNDPFGGWVYWSRINPDAVEVIEVSRGATTSAYGDRAMGGAISVLTRIPEVRHVWASAEGGSAGIADARGGYSNLFGKLGVSSFVRGLRSEGYYIVDENLRGSVDRRADVDFLVGDLRLDYFGNRERLTFKTNIVSERRQNGTALRSNSSSLGTAGVNYQRGGLAVSAYHSRGALRNGFSFVNGTRTFERQTLLQRVASEDTGGSIIWSRGCSKANLLIGADTHRAEGLSTDTVVSTGFVRRPGGRLWQQGAFVQGDLALGSKTNIYGGLRHDFTDRGNDFWSPRGGIAFSEGPRRWRLSAFRSFRAPTLNEFFRQFRVGNITTLGNNDLAPERMAAVDAGMDWRLSSFLVRTTVFWLQWHFAGTPSTGTQSIVLSIPEGVSNVSLVDSRISINSTGGATDYNIERCISNCHLGSATFSNIYSTDPSISTGRRSATGGTPTSTTAAAGDQFRVNFGTVGSGVADVTVSLTYQHTAVH